MRTPKAAAKRKIRLRWISHEVLSGAMRTRIAFISNRSGNTSLWVQESLGGAQRPVVAKEKRFLNAMGHLSITILDSSGKPTSARVSVSGEDARSYAPDDAWMHAEDSFVRSDSAFESHYFHSPGKSELTVPVGHILVEVAKGFEYYVARETVTCRPNARLVIRLKRLKVPGNANSRFVSADLHVHMNYGGAYRNTPANLVAQQSAENLFLVEDLVVNKELRIPDIAYFQTAPDRSSTPNRWLPTSV